MIQISSFKVFGITIDNKYTKPVGVNEEQLREAIDFMISINTIQKVVIIKKWV